MGNATNSPTKICNLALSKIGVEPISDITDTDKVSRSCNRLYSQVLYEVLEDHYWNFSTERATLSERADAPNHEFDNWFTLPSDFLKLRKFNGYPAENLDQVYQIENDRILTDQTTVEIVYTSKAEDTTKFPALFIKGLSFLLASELAMNLTQSLTLSEEMARAGERYLGKAKRRDASENRSRHRGMRHLLENSMLVKRRKISALG